MTIEGGTSGPRTEPSSENPAALAFDFGERRIGVAFANPVTRTSAALTTLPARNGKPVWQNVDELVNEWEPGILVVGVPYNMDGSESSMTKKALDFGTSLAERYGLPVETVDEQLTSAEAGIMLRAQRRAGQLSRKVRPGDIDSLAARLIAENWLSQQDIETKKS